jgi:hypothetical protein
LARISSNSPGELVLFNILGGHHPGFVAALIAAR